MEISHDFSPIAVMDYKSGSIARTTGAPRSGVSGENRRQGEAVPALPYYVTCRNCELLLYSAAPITERVCQRCGAELPEPQQGAPPTDPARESEDGESGVRPRETSAQ
jgi:hypothetical protein